MTDTHENVVKNCKKRESSHHSYQKLNCTQYKNIDPLRSKREYPKIWMPSKREQITPKPVRQENGSSRSPQIKTDHNHIDRKMKVKPHLLSVIAYNIPYTNVDLALFGKILMKQLLTGISPKQYEITRPWPDFTNKQLWVRITFVDMQTKAQFASSLPDNWNGDLMHIGYTTPIDVKVGNRLLSVKFRDDLEGNMNEVFHNAILWKDTYPFDRLFSVYIQK